MSDESRSVNHDEIERLLKQVRESSQPSDEADGTGDSSVSDGTSDSGATMGAESPAAPTSPADAGGRPAASDPPEGASSADRGGSHDAPESSSGYTAASQAASETRSRQTRSTGDDIDLLLRQTEEAISSIDSPVEGSLAGVTPFELEDLTGSPPSTDYATLDLLRDVELELKIELGRTEMYLEDVLKLKRGAVVALDRMAGDAVDVYVNGRLVARGEVLVLNDNFCVRVAELVSGDDLD